MSFASLTLKIG